MVRLRISITSLIVFASTTGTLIADATTNALPLFGEYQPGLQVFDLVDDSRNDRPLNALVWYPVDPSVVGEPLRYFQHYFEDGSEVEQRWWYESPFAGGVMDATPSDDRLFPLIALSHGNNAWAQQFAMLGESLASHGFVVVAPRHTGNAWGTPTECCQNDIDRPADMTFVLDWISQRNVDPSDLLFETVDVESIGVGGYSRGGKTIGGMLTGNSNGVAVPIDARPDAALLIDSGLPGFPNASLHVPTLAVGRPFRVSTLTVLAPELYGVEFDNSIHSSFSLLNCQFRPKLIEAGAPDVVMDEIGSDWPGCEDGLRPATEVQELMSKQAVAFFDKVLSNDSQHEALLDPFEYPLTGNAVVKTNISPRQLDTWRVLLTDPSGRRLGADLESGEPINDFGTAGRVVDPRFDPDLNLSVGELLPGEYTLSITTSGPSPTDAHLDTRLNVSGLRDQDIVSQLIALDQREIMGGGTIHEIRFRVFPLAGDLNNDGSVDAADASILFTSWGDVPPGDPIADLNGDNVVDAADASVVFVNWTGDLAAVPEPTRGLIVLCGVSVLAVCRRTYVS